MARRRLSMRNIKEVLRLKFAKKRSIREIGNSCVIGNSTVSDYIKRAENAGLAWPLPDDLDDTALENLLFPPKSNPDPPKRQMPSMEYLYKEKKKKSRITRLVKNFLLTMQAKLSR